MHRPALPILALTLAAGAAMAAPVSGEMTSVQGDWRLPDRAGQVLTISRGMGRLSAVDAAARKAGYAEGDILVQGLTYQSVVRLEDGRRLISYAGVCRARDGKGGWIVADCQLQVDQAGGGGPAVLSATPAFRLIAGQQGGRSAGPVLAGAPKPALAPGPKPAKTVSSAQPPAKPPPPADPNDTWARRSMKPEDLAAQDAATRRLNADITARNAAIEARNRKADADFKAAEAARKAKMAASKSAYDKSMADYRTGVAAQDAANAKAQADWQAAVKACKAGDRTQCAQPAPK